MTTTNEERLARLAGEVETPQAWLPEVGATTAGEVLRQETVEITGKDGSKRACEVFTLKLADGSEQAVWTWHTVLQQELIGKAKPGDFVAINFRGERQRQDGDGSYMSYRVAIESAPENVPDDLPEGF